MNMVRKNPAGDLMLIDDNGFTATRLNGQWRKGLLFTLSEMDDMLNLPEADATAEFNNAHAALSSLMPTLRKK